jgi:hypothetical protein
VPVTGIVPGSLYTHRPALAPPIKCEAPELAAPRGLRCSIATMRRSVERAQKKAAATEEDPYGRSAAVRGVSLQVSAESTLRYRNSMLRGSTKRAPATN